MCSFLCCYLILCCLTGSIFHPVYYMVTLKDAESPWVPFPMTNSILRYNSFASPLQLISLLCIQTSPSTQHFAAQGSFVLAFLEAGLNTLLIILLSHNFWSWWCNQCDKDSGSLLPQCLNHFHVARSLLMEGLNIPKAPGDLLSGLFWIALKMTTDF